MNWLQESLMMSSQVATPGAPGVAPASTPPANMMFPASSSPSSTNSSPAHYEGRIGMIHPSYPSPFTANLNFNLINNTYKQDKAEASSESFEGNLSPSSGTGSPRTDETLDKTSEPPTDPAEPETSRPEQISGLEMLRQQAQILPKPGAPGGLTIRQELQKQPSREVEINDVEENEELLIDEEMEEADSSRDKHEETFEEVPVEKVDTLKQFSNFQPYLNMKETTENGGINSLEKLQQVSFSHILIAKVENIKLKLSCKILLLNS